MSNKAEGSTFYFIFLFIVMVLPGMTQLMRKSRIALRLILKGSAGPTT